MRAWCGCGCLMTMSEAGSDWIEMVEDVVCDHSRLRLI